MLAVLVGGGEGFQFGPYHKHPVVVPNTAKMTINY